jgi:hypothetical protein
VRLVIENLGTRMPEGVHLEELGSLVIRVQGVMQLLSGYRDHDVQENSSHPHFIVSVARCPDLSRVRALTELCGLSISVETYVAPSGHVQCKRCQLFVHTQRHCGHASRCVACGGIHLTGDCPARPEQPICCICGSNHTAKYRGCVNWKKADAALAKKAPAQSRQTVATSHTEAPKTKQAEPSVEQKVLGERWSHVGRGGRLVKSSILSLLTIQSTKQSQSNLS